MDESESGIRVKGKPRRQVIAKRKHDDEKEGDVADETGNMNGV